MPAWETAIRLGAGILLILANAFFVAVEFGLTRLRQLSDEEVASDPGLRKGWEMTERLEIHLTGCQLGISTTSILLGVVAEPAVTELLRPAVDLLGLTGMGEGALRTTSVVLAIVVLNLAHKIWGEQAPTYLGVERPEAVVRHLAPFLAIWTRVMHPVIRVGDGLAKWTLGLMGVEMTRSWMESDDEEGVGGPAAGRTELKRQLAELLSRGEIREDRKDEVMRALEIGEMPVREIMVPRDSMVVLSTSRSAEETLRAISGSSFVRYPVASGDGEEFLGILYLPSLFDDPDRLLSRDIPLRELASEVPILDPRTPVSEVIDRLQEAGQEAAFIREDGVVVGMVTITDAFEAIAGQVEDPLD